MYRTNIISTILLLPKIHLEKSIFFCVALMLCGWQVGGVAALAWLGVAQLADARLCFIGCILTTIVSIGM